MVVQAGSPEAAKLLKRVRAHGRVRRKPGEMNRLEAEYAACLEIWLRAGEIAWYAFEPVKLRLAETCTYTPDFLVLLADGELQCHEVKGTKRENGREVAYWEGDARVKIKLAAELFPFVFVAVWKTQDGWKEERF